ncbi:HAD family hydrolase [Vibrio sp. E150_011]
MRSNEIKNVVFDVGNVIVRWAPEEIVRLTFGNTEPHAERAKTIFQSDIWSALNKGLLTEQEASARYITEQGLSAEECDQLFYYVKHTQLVLHGSVNLIERVKHAGYGVYALTDNVVEIVDYLKTNYDFWSLFDGATVSAEVGLLKPQAAIYQSLLSDHNLKASESVFIDDMPYNVEGAEAVGMHAVQFTNSTQCECALKDLGLIF